MGKYRLYIDESGSHNYSDRDSIKHRYLGLVGVIVEVIDYETFIQPQVTALKKMFSEDPDDLTVLHRDEIVNKQGAFFRLKDKDVEKVFNDQLINLVTEGNYVLLGVVLDKKSHLERYGNAATHPYHYCLSVLLERYVLFLEKYGSSGDVMSEARGKKEDNALRDAYTRFHDQGTSFISGERIKARLTSRNIKLRTKQNCAEGLELADLLVLATKFHVLNTYDKIDDLTDNFCKLIIGAAKGKFRNNGHGYTKGFGIKLIE